MVSHPILDELAEACRLEIPPEYEAEELESFLKDVMIPKASELSDSVWTTLSDETQLWAVSAFEKFNSGEDLPPLGDLRNMKEAIPISELVSGNSETESEEGAEVVVEAEETPEPEAEDEQPAEETTLTKRRGPVGGKSHADEEVITILYDGANPKRPGSISWYEWEELQDGMTVKQFLSVTTTNGKTPRRAELNGWHKQGLVRIAPAA